MAFPSNLYYIPITSKSSGWVESDTNWAYQYDASSLLAGNATFKSKISSAANIAIYNSNGDKCPRMIALDLTNNKLLLGWNCAKSNTQNRVFRIYVDSTINEVDSASVFSLANAAHRWGFNNFSNDSTATDSVGSATGSKTGSLTLGITGKFGNSVRWDSPSTSYFSFGNVTEFNSVSSLTVEFMMYLTSVSGVQTFFIKNISTINTFYVQINAGNFNIGLANGVASVGQLAISGNILINTWYHVVVVFDGSASGNENRLKLILNNSQKTLSFTNNIPSSTGNLSAANLLLGFTSVNTCPATNSLVDEAMQYTVAKSANFISDRYTQFFNPTDVLETGTAVPDVAVSSIIKTGAYRYELVGSGFGTGSTVTVNGQSATVNHCSNNNCVITINSNTPVGNNSLVVTSAEGQVLTTTITITTVNSFPAYVYIPISSNTGWVESTASWAYAYDLSALLISYPALKTLASTRNNIAVYNFNGDKVSSYIQADLTNNKLILYWFGPKSKYSTISFRIYFNTAINEADSTQMYSSLNTLHLWSMNNFADDASVVDIMGLNNGTKAGNAILGGTGKFGNSIQFTGVSGRLDCGNVASFSSITSFTKEFMWLPSLNYTLTEVLFTRQLTATADYTVYTTTATRLYIRINNGTSNNTGYLDIASLTANWYHVVIIYDGLQSTNANRLRLYLNGVLQTLTFTNTIPPSFADLSANAFFIGSAGTNTSLCRLDEIVQYSDIKSINFIQDRYNQFFDSNTRITAANPSSIVAITQHPQNATVVEGQIATFSVIATGTGTLHYQWRANGINVGVDSPSFGGVTTLLQNGSLIDCIVTDDFGSVTSNAAVLTVEAIPSNITYINGMNKNMSLMKFRMK